LGDDFRAFLRRTETGRQEFWFSSLLDNAETACAERNEPAIMTESGNPNTDRLGGLEDRLSFFDLYNYVIDLQFDLVCHVTQKLPLPWWVGMMGRGKTALTLTLSRQRERVKYGIIRWL
jgi:hypothetical protein